MVLMVVVVVVVDRWVSLLVVSAMKRNIIDTVLLLFRT